jgi:hypothetical protein
MAQTNGTVTRYGWHFIREEKELGFSDDRKVRVNKRLGFKKEYGAQRILVCSRGMHASPTIAAAYDCWRHLIDHGWTTARMNGSWLCWVKVEGSGYGKQYSRSIGAKKFVGTHRTVLGMISIEEVHGILNSINERCDNVGVYSLYDSKTYGKRQAMKAIFAKMVARNKKNRVTNELG